MLTCLRLLGIVGETRERRVGHDRHDQIVALESQSSRLQGHGGRHAVLDVARDTQQEEVQLQGEWRLHGSGHKGTKEQRNCLF